MGGSTGDSTISKNSRIVINAADKDTLSSMAEAFAADYKDIVGNDISVVYGSESDVKAGDFYFALTAKRKNTLGKKKVIFHRSEIPSKQNPRLQQVLTGQPEPSCRS